MLFRLLLGLIGLVLYPFRKLKNPPSTVEKVVYLLWGGIGNAVMALPAISALLDECGNKLLVYAIHPAAGKLLSPSNVVVMPVLKSPFGFLDTAKNLHRVHPQISITNFSSPTFLTSFLSYISGARYRMGYNRGMRGILFNIPLQAERMSERKADTQAVEQLFSQKTDFQPTVPRCEGFGRRFLSERGIEGKILGIHPGGGFKSWGEKRYVEFIDSLEGATVILMGGEADREVIERMRTKKRIYRYIGEDILKTADLISKFSLFLSGDTGLMHIASSVGVPVIAIFGPTDPVKNRPGGDVRIIRRELPCSPCYRYRVPRCKRRDCLDIPVSEVLKEVKQRMGT